MKKLIPAICMLLISAMLLGTSTYAWFTMNTTVTATNMQVKAVAEQGILINEVATATDTNWDDEATTTQTAGIQLRATSTADTKTWYVAYSKVSNSAASATISDNSEDLNGDYSTLTLTSSQVAAVPGSNAEHNIYYVDTNGTSGYQDGEGYYVKYTYYIKSSADAITCGVAKDAQNLNIVAPTVTGSTSSEDLDKSLRVAVVVGGKAYIYAPLNSEVGTYYVGTAHTATTPLTGNQPTALTSIPATTATGTAVYVYLYFEGEDENCNTDNVTSSLDNLTVTVGFTLVTNADAVTDKGVSLS